MNIEQKLDYFTEIIMGQAAAAKRRVSREKSERSEATVKAVLEEAEARINERVRNAAHEAKKTRYKAIAAATACERESFYQKRQLCIKELFAEVEERLRAFVTSDEYKGFLNEAIHKATQLGGFSIVQLTRRDTDLGLALSPLLTIEPCDRDFLGGFILYDQPRTLRADYSFLSRLQKAMLHFGQEHGKG
jgi:vacuolar-type H+-ATPase subunit E/Vma4